MWCFNNTEGGCMGVIESMNVRMKVVMWRGVLWGGCAVERVCCGVGVVWRGCAVEMV